MTGDCRSLRERHVVLVVLPAADGAPPPGGNEERREVEVPPLPRLAEQLHQRRLDLRMAACPQAFPPFGRPEDPVNVVRESPGHAKQAIAPRRPLMRDRRLDQVARAVQLVHVLEVGPAFSRFLEHEVGVQVAVWLLGGGDLLDNHIQDAP